MYDKSIQMWLLSDVFFYLDYSPLRALTPDLSGGSGEGEDPAGVQCLEPSAGQLQPACPGPERGECPATHHQRRAPGSDCEDFAFYSLARLEEENKRREEERAGLKRNNPLSAFCYSDLTPWSSPSLCKK